MIGILRVRAFLISESSSLPFKIFGIKPENDSDTFPAYSSLVLVIMD